MALAAIVIAWLALPLGAGPALASTPGVPDKLPSTVSLTVLQPTPNEVVTGATLSLHVINNGYVCDARYAGSPNSSKFGHYHEILDGSLLVDMAPYRDCTRDNMPMVGVTDGPHTLTLVPSNSDHSTVDAAGNPYAAVTHPLRLRGPVPGRTRGPER